MSNPSPPTFNYSNLPFTVALVGNQLVFTFTIPTKPGLQLSNPIYVNTANMTIEKDRFNSNLVEIGDDKGVYTLNYLNQVPPAGSLNAFIASLLALVPVPSPPVTLSTAAGATGVSLVANGVGPNLTIYDVKGTGTTTTTRVGSDVIINTSSTDVTLATAAGGTGVSLVQDGTGPSLAIYDVKGTGTTTTTLVGSDIVINTASTDVTLTTAAGATGVSLVQDGTGPSLAVYDIKAGTGITATLVGSDVVIAATGATAPSPAFIGFHTYDPVYDYSSSTYNAVSWDFVQQSGSDLTYVNATKTFTANVDGDYLVTYDFSMQGAGSSFCAVVGVEPSHFLLAQDLAKANEWNAAVMSGTRVVGNYLWTEPTASAKIAEILPFLNGDTFSLAIRPDPTYSGVAAMHEAVLNAGSGDDFPMAKCTIKRLL